jgi:hypothetical protein
VLSRKVLETGLRGVLLTPKPPRGKGCKLSLPNSMGVFTSGAGKFSVPARFFTESN